MGEAFIERDRGGVAEVGLNEHDIGGRGDPKWGSPSGPRGAPPSLIAFQRPGEPPDWIK